MAYSEGIFISTPLSIHCLWGSADKSLARPGRKQATATKLGIYSAFSPRSSVHFLALYSYFIKNYCGLLLSEYFAFALDNVMHSQLIVTFVCTPWSWLRVSTETWWITVIYIYIYIYIYTSVVIWNILICIMQWRLGTMNLTLSCLCKTLLSSAVWYRAVWYNFPAFSRIPCCNYIIKSGP
jgi:hypothetical protein